MNKVWHKGLPFSPEVLPYLRRMALVDEHREALLRLQGVWDSLALLGQMSGTATDIAHTRTAFQNLTATLLDSLARRLRSHALQRMDGKARVAIDILVRNLFERTADVGFLAVDGPLCAHAALDVQDPDHAASRAELQARFAAYTAKYSVYDDVIVLSPRGEVLARRNESGSQAACHEPWVAEALASGAAYFERHGTTALLGGRPGLIYARALRTPGGGNDVIGLLCLSFRLEDEMAAVFRQLLSGADEHAVICLLDAQQRVLQSSDAWQVPPGAQLQPKGERVFFAGRDYLCASAGASGYEGYIGPPGWQACVLTPLEWAFEAGEDHGAGDELRRLGATLDTRQLFDAELQGIPLEARRIQRNLSRTLWNGKLRSHAQANGDAAGAGFATTLLNEVQRTGGQLRQVFEQAIDQLQSHALEAVFDGALFQARLAIDIMDRNLYERANDCRWWALDVRLRRALAAQGTAQAQAAAAEAQQVLQHINGLYTVYSLLLVFDPQGRVVAVSDPAQAGHVGQRLEAGWVNAALTLRDPERYVVSQHEASALYETAQPTYIYATSLQHEGQVVGGIAIVFDGAPQFAAMLADALPDTAGTDVENTAAGLFVARNGRVVASSDARWPAGTTAPVPPAMLAGLAAGNTLRTELEIDGMVYAAGLAMSQGYREYRQGQAASPEDVAAVLLLPLGPRMPAQAAASETGFAPPPAQAAAETLDIAAFSVAGQWLGLPAGQLVEAVEQPRLTAIPNAPRALVGMLQHEGRMLPVLDLNLALYGRAPDTLDGPVIICRNERGQGLAVRVDELGPVFTIPAAQALPSPGTRARLVRGAEGSSHRMLTLLPPEDLWAHVGMAAPSQTALPAP
ncbi:chemotaxis protein CheW [Roseateles sp. P5_E7]